VEAMQLSYVSSGRDLMPGPLPRALGPALVLADPDYDALADEATPSAAPAGTVVANATRSAELATRHWHFTSEAHFRKEMDAVVAAWKVSHPGAPIQAIDKSHASEEELARHRRPKLLHVITHGFCFPDLRRDPAERPLGEALGSGLAAVRQAEDPRLRSGVALAGANRWRERDARGCSDGLLTALEVENNLDLWGTELVVLSACETDLGAVRVGEGVLGLRRAFQNAGAQTVLASLWRVPDAETAELMSSFFTKWSAGMGKAAALRSAQCELIAKLRREKAPRRRQAPPLFWAGFVCHGRPQ
jgi:hypothetical protein